MQLARVIRLSVNKSYQFIILKVRRARAAVFTLYVQSSNLHIKSCRQCYCAQWCIQTSPEVWWNYSVRHLPNMILCTFIFTIPGFIMKNNVSSNHLSVNKSYRFIYFAPIGGTCPRHVPLHHPAHVRAYKQFKIMCKLPLELLKIGMIITVHGPRTLRCVFNSYDAWRIIIPFYNNSAIYTVISLNRPKPPFPLRCNFTRYIFTFSIILVTNFPHLITVVVHDFPTMSLSNTKWLMLFD